MAFSEAQLKALDAKLDARKVKSREAHGTMRAYIEGWHAVAEANRIFGYDGWDRSTVATECVWSGMVADQHAADYIAKVRIVVRAGDITITREGCGSGHGKAPSAGEAHDLALKGAETDATKRALATFGNPFGLALYDPNLKGVRNLKQLGLADASEPSRWELRLANGQVAQAYATPEAFADALTQSLSDAADMGILFALWEHNVATVRAAGRTAKQRSPKAAVAKALVQHLKARAIALAKGAAQIGQAPQTEQSIGSALAKPNEAEALGQRIDKSALTIAEPKRIRSKDHLRYVAKQSCLICGRTPSQAHHIGFAQPKALGRKVSDEFTVPLCAIHHSEIHHFGDERSWWTEHKIDPMLEAKRLWQESRTTRAAEKSIPDSSASPDP